MLRDDQVIEIFDSPLTPPSWIEPIDIQNQEYQFCDDVGQKYVGEVTSASVWGLATWKLAPDGIADIKNVLVLIDRAMAIEPNDRFADLQSLRDHCITGERE